MTKATEEEQGSTLDPYQSTKRCRRDILKEGGGETEMHLPITEDLLEHIFKLITSHKDRNAVSLVCKSWNTLEASGREKVFVGNCYAVSPERVANRFARLKSITIKGKPRFADFGLLPQDWGASVQPWIQTLAQSHPFLEELRLKRMLISDECLRMIASSFPNFKVLVLISCEGFSTDGLANIAANCRHLTHLQLTENILVHKTGDWLNAFPDNFTSLVSLDFEDLEHAVDFEALEALVGRCTGLKTLKLNRAVVLSQLPQLLLKCPQVTELGVGSFSPSISKEDTVSACNAFRACGELQSLSGFWVVATGYLSVMYPICLNLVSLNLSYSPISGEELADVVQYCQSIRKLWLMDSVEDKGLKAVALSCKGLEDFRVYPREGQGPGVTEEGLVYIAGGCPNLRAILYFCNQMTNSAVKVMARDCQKLESFRLCIMEPSRPDHLTHGPMDEGFAEIVRQCKDLTRLSVSGWLTDKAFEYIGMYGKKLERLSVAFAGESDVGLQHVLRGCLNLKKLEIRDSPFGDMALLSGLHRYEAMRSLWMSNCSVTISGCQWLANQKPRLNVEVIQKNDRDNTTLVESLYVYRSVAGHRNDRPQSVMSL